MDLPKVDFCGVRVSRIAVGGNPFSGIGHQDAALDQALKDYYTVARIKETRAELSAGLVRLGFEVTPSQTNFVWAKPPAPGAARVYSELKSRKILVRYWARDGLSDLLRITVGTPEEIAALIGALGEILGASDER